MGVSCGDNTVRSSAYFELHMSGWLGWRSAIMTRNAYGPMPEPCTIERVIWSDADWPTDWSLMLTAHRSWWHGSVDWANSGCSVLKTKHIPINTRHLDTTFVSYFTPHNVVFFVKFKRKTYSHIIQYKLFNKMWQQWPTCQVWDLSLILGLTLFGLCLMHCESSMVHEYAYFYEYIWKSVHCDQNVYWTKWCSLIFDVDRSPRLLWLLGLLSVSNRFFLISLMHWNNAVYRRTSVRF